jgi:hypothetical protein
MVFSDWEMSVSINLSQPAIRVLDSPDDPSVRCVEVLFPFTCVRARFSFYDLNLKLCIFGGRSIH